MPSMHLPIVTTILATYRRPHLLKRAIRSILNQTFTDFQLCVYDNASEDETGAVVRDFMKADSRSALLLSCKKSWLY